MSTGVATVLARMDSHPEEFYGEEKKWAFIYKEYFRDVMTETERGMLFEKLKQIRRTEFDKRVMEAVLVKEEEEACEVEEQAWADDVADSFKYSSANRIKWNTKLTPEGYEVTQDNTGRKFINGVLVK